MTNYRTPRFATGLTTAAPRTVTFPSIAAWLPALAGMLVICAESTRVMGADHTMVWLARLCTPVAHIANAQVFELNHVLRKCGHFLGYGTLGVVLMQGWLSLLLARTHQAWAKVRLIAGACAIVSVALVASLDELHQSFLPNRTACVSDVLLDTAGAVLLTAFAFFIMRLRRKRMLTRLLQLRSVRQWQQSMWLFRHALLEQSR